MLASLRTFGDSGAGCGGYQGVGIKRVDNPNHLEGRIKKKKNIIAASSIN